MTKQIWPRHRISAMMLLAKAELEMYEIVLGRENIPRLDQDYSKVPILTHSRISRAHGKLKSLTSCHCKWRLSLAADSACTNHALNSTECSLSTRWILDCDWNTEPGPGHLYWSHDIWRKTTVVLETRVYSDMHSIISIAMENTITCILFILRRWMLTITSI